MPYQIPEIFVDSFKDLKLHVYTVGYPSEGESILLLLEKDGKVLLTILTDSYAVGKDNGTYNHIHNILENWDSPPINYFIWTHPHKDHSVGIEKVLDKFDPKHEAKIILPNTFDNTENYSLCEEAEKAFNFLINNYNSNRKYNVFQWGRNETETKNTILKLSDAKSGRTIHCSIYVLAPYTPLAIRRSANTGGNDFNAISIVYRFEINGLQLLLCGDMAKTSIQWIDEDNYKIVHFIKIPHHGSDEPKTLLDKLILNQIEHPLANTTIYKSKNRPVPDIIARYKKLGCDVYSTGEGEELFGCIETVYDVSRLSNEVPLLSGNGIKL